MKILKEPSMSLMEHWNNDPFPIQNATDIHALNDTSSSGNIPELFLTTYNTQPA